MTAPLLAALAGSAILAAALLLRRLGPRFRVGRLLASAPAIALSEALAIAASGRPAYIRVHGRISSDEEFPDEHDRPLVFRRRRVEVQELGRWRTIADDREAVPFGVEERGTYVGVDAAALDAGLVVVTREAEGQVADLPAEHREGLDPAAPSRLVIEQVSAVEHAFVAGVPVMRGDETVIVAGLDRPLILTTLDVASAMRVLARDHRRHVWLATLLLTAGGALLVAAAVALVLGAP
jgi:hypothetical protein